MILQRFPVGSLLFQNQRIVKSMTLNCHNQQHLTNVLSILETCKEVYQEFLLLHLQFLENLQEIIIFKKSCTFYIIFKQYIMKFYKSVMALHFIYVR